MNNTFGAVMSWLVKSGPVVLGALTGHAFLAAVLAVIVLVCWLLTPAAEEARQMLADVVRRRRTRRATRARPDVPDR